MNNEPECENAGGLHIGQRKKRTLYIGVTSNLPGRVWQHQNNVTEGFSKKHGTHSLVYFETHNSMDDAILKEKQMKKWERKWKIALIESCNPYWRDLSSELNA